jgi:hypothetical protein
VASRGTEHDGLVLAVGALVLVGILLMGAWIAHADAIASSAPPHVKVAPSGTGPDGSSPAATTTTTTPAPAHATASNDGGLSQTLAVSVLPGSLTISPPAGSVSPTAGSVSPSGDSMTFSHDGDGHGDTYRGTLPLVRIVDARGSLAGWNASVSLQGIDGLSASQLAGAQLCVNPDKPTIVSGNPGEVRAAKHSCGGVGDPISVFFAPPPGGGGMFTDSATMTLRIPAGNGADQLSTALAVTVH